MAKLQIGTKGIKLIQSFEGCRLKGYVCPAGKLTIGYGHTGLVDGKAIYVGMKISKAKAIELLKKDLDRFENAVNELVDVKITQNQFDALTSFAYNCGEGNLKSSTLLRKVNTKDFKDAADEFLKWNKGGGKVLLGLTRRRKAERSLFLKK